MVVEMRRRGVRPVEVGQPWEISQAARDGERAQHWRRWWAMVGIGGHWVGIGWVRVGGFDGDGLGRCGCCGCCGCTGLWVLWADILGAVVAPQSPGDTSQASFRAWLTACEGPKRPWIEHPDQESWLQYVKVVFYDLDGLLIMYNNVSRPAFCNVTMHILCLPLPEFLSRP